MDNICTQGNQPQGMRYVGRERHEAGTEKHS